MTLSRLSPLTPVFTDPELAPAAQFLYENGLRSHPLTNGLTLEKPSKGVRGSSAGDPKIMLSTIALSSYLVTGETLNLAFQVVRSQAQIIRNNIADQGEEFMLVYEERPAVAEECIRFRSPRFENRILHSHVVATLSEIDEMDENSFRDAFDRAAARYEDSYVSAFM